MSARVPVGSRKTGQGQTGRMGRGCWRPVRLRGSGECSHPVLGHVQGLPEFPDLGSRVGEVVREVEPVVLFGFFGFLARGFE